ncbi:hypothetical protein AVBRAN9334_10020, partial [Campylobacter sp. RM9334]|uniref:flagellin hook IN motif-containing protein n=1 Tax=Campylobacter sp. RM9334 TaxID=2735732 RepID=UPI001D65BB16|nr:hypothetical protein [Campylobacter sp. RM9334]
INGVTIGSIEVKDKDGNGALRAAINSVKDQTGVEASVDEKGRLVLANRDGRGIKITDGVDKNLDLAANQGATTPDKHLLYTTGDAAAGVAAAGQDAMDLSLKATWAGGGVTTAQGGATAITGNANKSILNEKNTFEEVQAAHYEQDARIAADGYRQGKAIKPATDGKVDLSGVKAEAQGALHALANNKTQTADTDQAAAAAALVAVQANHNSLDDANKAIDNAMKALQKLVDGGKGLTMDKNAAEDAIVSHAMQQFLKGLKEGLNEGNREGLSSMIGLTNDNKTNFGRLSFSSTNGKDIVVEATRDYVGADNQLHSMNITSAIGYDKNVSEKTVSLRETNATIDRETADAMGFNANDWQATDAGDNKNGYAAGVMTL